MSFCIVHPYFANDFQIVTLPNFKGKGQQRYAISEKDNGYDFFEIRRVNPDLNSIFTNEYCIGGKRKSRKFLEINPKKMDLCT